MYKELRFGFYAIKKNVQSSAELRTSFLMNVIGMAINNIAFIFLWIFLIQSVGVIGGWQAADIVGLQGFSALAYGIIFSVAAGIRKIPEYVTSGSFDRFMLSPKNLLLRIATSSFSASAVGDVVFGIICLVIYGFLIHISFLQVLFAAILLVFATAVFLAIMVMISSASFYFVDAASVTDGMFEMFFTPALFHGGAFQGAMRFIYTFLIPSLLIGTLPVEAVRDISFVKLGLMGVLTCVWLFLSIRVFERAIRRYESSNFMTFGN